MEWLSPLLVLIDAQELNQFETEEELSKLINLIVETISQLPAADQIKTFYAINNGFMQFQSKCQKYSKENFAKISRYLIRVARQLTGISEEEKKNLI